jgi:hypothetical protein
MLKFEFWVYQIPLAKYFNYREGEYSAWKNTARKYLAGKITLAILILPGKKYCPIQLEVEKYIEQHKEPETF